MRIQPHIAGRIIWSITGAILAYLIIDSYIGMHNRSEHMKSNVNKTVYVLGVETVITDYSYVDKCYYLSNGTRIRAGIINNIYPDTIH